MSPCTPGKPLAFVVPPVAVPPPLLVVKLAVALFPNPPVPPLAVIPTVGKVHVMDEKPPFPPFAVGLVPAAPAAPAAPTVYVKEVLPPSTAITLDVAPPPPPPFPPLLLALLPPPPPPAPHALAVTDVTPVGTLKVLPTPGVESIS